jgi:hypothetical protein
MLRSHGIRLCKASVDYCGIDIDGSVRYDIIYENDQQDATV